MNRKLRNNQNIAILTLGGNDYLQECQPDPMPVYILYPGANQVHPGVELYSMTADEIVNVSTTEYITDGNGSTARKIISPRPKNIARR